MTARFNTENLVTDLKAVVRDSEELLAAVSDATGQKAEELREKLSEKLEAARIACCKLEGKTQEHLETADKVIREHPYQSMGVALVIGVAIGAVVASRK
jgi:ElaB/YqjD/DUF883 family membrane-anchored ribosome-binding protein